VFQTNLLDAQAPKFNVIPLPRPLKLRTSYRVDTHGWGVRVDWRCKEDEAWLAVNIEQYCWAHLTPPQAGALLYALGDRFSRGMARPPFKIGQRLKMQDIKELREALKDFDLYRFPLCLPF